MAQNHCNLPWLGNLSQFPHCLKQHIQGVLCHGKVLTMYRTFHNIKNTANLQLHTLLLKLEDIYKLENELPDTVYLQIDGASENTAKVVIAMCELIIHKRLTKKLVLTRLLVGHTHCDIDGVFGRLWLYIRDKHCLSPEDYASFIRTSLSKSGSYEANVHDIFVIPDYASLFQGCIDKSFQNYSKKEDTQHQFIFEAVEINTSFPLGVKTTYRAYSADEVIELTGDKYDDLEEAQDINDDIIQLYPRKVKTITFPEATAQNCAGMYILQKVPNVTSILPQGFIADSRAAFDKTMQFIEAKYGKNAPNVVTSWKDFAKNVPASDDANQYLKEKPDAFHIPFHNLLFNGILVNLQGKPIQPVAVAVKKLKNSIPHVRACDSVNWSRRGKTFKDRDPNINKTRVGLEVPPAEFVEGAAKPRRKQAPTKVRNPLFPAAKRVRKQCRPNTKDKSEDENNDSDSSDAESLGLPPAQSVIGSAVNQEIKAKTVKRKTKEKSDDDYSDGNEDNQNQQQSSHKNDVPIFRQNRSSRKKQDAKIVDSILAESDTMEGSISEDESQKVQQQLPVQQMKKQRTENAVADNSASEVYDVGYVTDPGSVDANNFVQRYQNYTVNNYGNTKVFIGRRLAISDLRDITITQFHDLEFSKRCQHVITGIYTLQTDTTATLYFKLETTVWRVQSVYYIPCTELMSVNHAKRTKERINWFGPNPTTTNRSLIKKRVRREFLMDDGTKKFFLGTVNQRVKDKPGSFLVQFDDGEKLEMDELEIMETLLSSFTPRIIEFL